MIRICEYACVTDFHKSPKLLDSLADAVHLKRSFYYAQAPPENCHQSYHNNVTNSNKIFMERNIPRAAIHVGIDKNNHYNYSRKRLNFEIVKDGKIVPLGFQSVPLHERLQHRLDELGFKPYMAAKRPDQVSRNSPNCTVGIIFSGDHDVLN